MRNFNNRQDYGDFQNGSYSNGRYNKGRGGTRGRGSNRGRGRGREKNQDWNTYNSNYQQTGFKSYNFLNSDGYQMRSQSENQQYTRPVIGFQNQSPESHVIYNSQSNGTNFKNRNYRSYNMYRIPVEFIKSQEVYDPSNFLNEYIRKHPHGVENRPSITEELKNDEKRIENLTIEEKPNQNNNQQTDNINSDNESDSSDEQEENNNDDEIDEDIDMAAFSKWASRDIGGQGEGFEYQYEDSDDKEDERINIETANAMVSLADDRNLIPPASLSDVDAPIFNCVFRDVSLPKTNYTSFCEEFSRIYDCEPPSMKDLINSIQSKGRYLYPIDFGVDIALKEAIDASTLSETLEASESSLSIQSAIENLAQLQDAKNKKQRRAAEQALEDMTDKNLPPNKKKLDLTGVDPMFHQEMQETFDHIANKRKLKKMRRELAHKLSKATTEGKESEVRSQLISSTQDLSKLQRANTSNGYVNLSLKYPIYMTIQQAVIEIEYFIQHVTRTSLPFPKMKDPEARDLIQDLAEAYKLEYKIKGAETNPHIVLVKRKGQNLLSVNNKRILEILEYGSTVCKILECSDRVLNLNIIKGNKDMTKLKPRKRVVEKFKDGHVVGIDAEKIESYNLGHQLLSKMGWKEGMGLGTRNTGIPDPVVAIVKNSRIGLGNSA